MKVLIVDDELDILELMSDEFKFYGHVTKVASSGNDAVKILNQEKFDVVVSDFKMPNGNGMVVLNHVNKLDPRPAFYFVSGQSDLSVDDCIKAGAHDFFPKPFDLEALVKKIEMSNKN